MLHRPLILVTALGQCMVELVNMLVSQVVEHVRRVDLLLKMVITPSSHGQVSGYYRNTIRIIQRKKPSFWRGFFLKGARQVLYYLVVGNLR